MGWWRRVTSWLTSGGHPPREHRPPPRRGPAGERRAALGERGIVVPPDVGAARRARGRGGDARGRRAAERRPAVLLGAPGRLQQRGPGGRRGPSRPAAPPSVPGEDRGQLGGLRRRRRDLAGDRLPPGRRPGQPPHPQPGLAARPALPPRRRPGPAGRAAHRRRHRLAGNGYRPRRGHDRHRAGPAAAGQPSGAPDGLVRGVRPLRARPRRGPLVRPLRPDR